MRIAFPPTALAHLPDQLEFLQRGDRLAIAAHRPFLEHSVPLHRLGRDGEPLAGLRAMAEL